MKKKILLLLLAFFAVSTNVFSQINAQSSAANKRLATEYLNREFPRQSSWEVMSAGPTDSLATPFGDFLSIKLRLARAENTMINANSRSEMQDANVRFNQIYRDFLNATSKHDFPEGPGKNRLGFKAEVKSPFSGKSKTVYFFFNQNENTIGHSSMSNEKEVKEIMSSIESFEESRKVTDGYLKSIGK